MNHYTRKAINFLLANIFLFLVYSCSSPVTRTDQENKDSLIAVNEDSLSGMNSDKPIPPSDTSITQATNKNTGRPQVLVYNFHVTNRCAACIAIEEATTKTLSSFYAEEMKQGRIRQYILNVDDEANKEISEKYEAFGSGIFVTRVLKGKETTTDLTGEGFKYARNKPEKFIEILKNKIAEYLK